MNKRYVEPDILRGIAIIGVMLIHITASIIESGSNFSIFINQAFRFAVPAFLLLSGWGLTISKKANQGYFYFLWKQVSKLIILYFIWSLVYYLFRQESYSLLGFVKGFILGLNFYHLYYVPVIIFLYVIYPILLKITIKTYGLLISLIITILSQYADLITGITAFSIPINVFNWLFYFVFGIWLAINFDSKVQKIKKNRTMIILSFLVTLTVIILETKSTGVITSMRPSIIIYSISFALLVISINWGESLVPSIILQLAKYSYGIYLSHAIVLVIFESLFRLLNIHLNSVLYVVLALFIITPISIIITIIIDKFIKISSEVFNNTLKKSDNIR